LVLGGEPSLKSLHFLVSSWIVASQLIKPKMEKLDHRGKKKKKKKTKFALTYCSNPKQGRPQ